LLKKESISKVKNLREANKHKDKDKNCTSPIPFGKATFITSSDKPKIGNNFSYDNVYISTDYHLVKHKKSNSDSLEIIPNIYNANKRSSLVSFNKLVKRQAYPKIKSETRLLGLGELGDQYFKKHSPSVDFGSMAKRDASKYLTNKKYCGHDYDHNKESFMKDLKKGVPSFKTQSGRYGYNSIYPSAVDDSTMDYDNKINALHKLSTYSSK